MGTPRRLGRAAAVVWELSEEGTVVVDVDAPVRPFGAVPLTPPRGTLVRDLHDDLDGLDEPGERPERVVEGKRRTLPPL